SSQNSRWRAVSVALCVVGLTGWSSGPTHAAAQEIALSGAGLSLFWVVPFAGMLASLAFFPIIAPNFWHRRYGLVAPFWALAFLVPFAARFGAGVAIHELAHVVLLEYLPFVILVGSLFVIAGGIFVGGALHGGPTLNVTILLIGTVLASF